MTEMTHDQLLKLIRKLEQERGQAQLARDWGIDPSYLSRILAGTRLPGPAILDALGLVKLPDRYMRRK